MEHVFSQEASNCDIEIERNYDLTTNDEVNEHDHKLVKIRFFYSKVGRPLSV